MALFNRQKSNDVPAELQPYYEAPRSGPRGWLMWLVRTLALLIVVGVLIVAGRWGWQKIQKNDDKVGTSISQQGKLGSSSTSKPSTGSPNKGNVTPSDQSPTTSSTTTPSTSSTSQPASSAASNTAQSPASSSAQSSNSALANTGPGNTALVFGLVSMAGVLVYQLYLRFKKHPSA